MTLYPHPQNAIEIAISYTQQNITFSIAEFVHHLFFEISFYKQVSDFGQFFTEMSYTRLIYMVLI